MSRSTPVVLILPAILAISACGQKPAEMTNEANNASEAPDVGLTSAPGLSHSYDYRFGIDAGKIASLQEQHAAACEALGADKCRITGLTFFRKDADEATGTLELSLVPDLARKFGKDAIAAVEAAKGTVSSVEIAATDQAATLDSSSIDAAAARNAQEKLQAELARSGGSGDYRSDVQRRIEEQNVAEREARARNDEARAALARTPMRFTYSTEGFLPGISIDRTTWAALDFAGMLLNALLALLVVLAALAIPVGLILLGLAYGRQWALRLWGWLAPRPQPEAS